MNEIPEEHKIIIDDIESLIKNNGGIVKQRRFKKIKNQTTEEFDLGKGIALGSILIILFLFGGLLLIRLFQWEEYPVLLHIIIALCGLPTGIIIEYVFIQKTFSHEGKVE